MANSIRDFDSKFES